MALRSSPHFPALPKGGHDKKLIGYFQSDTGTINQLVHFWKFEDDADRRAHWEAVFANTDFVMGFAGKFRPLVMSQEVEAASCRAMATTSLRRDAAECPTAGSACQYRGVRPSLSLLTCRARFASARLDEADHLVRNIGFFEHGDLLGSELHVHRGDRVVQVMQLGCTHDRRGDDRLRQ